MDEEMLVDHRPRYLLSLTESKSGRSGTAVFGVCIVDVSTAAFEVGSFEDDMYQSRLGPSLPAPCSLQIHARPPECLSPCRCCC